MSGKSKFKSTAGGIISVIGTIIGVLPGMLKKRPYVLWQWIKPARTWFNCGTYSARQCRKAKAALIRIDSTLADADFAILRKGVPPPKDGPK